MEKKELKLIKHTEIGKGPLSMHISFTDFGDEMVTVFMRGCNIHNAIMFFPKDFYEFAEKVKEASDNLKKHYNR